MQGWPLTITIAVVLSVAGAAIVAAGGGSEESIRSVIRHTGKTSLLLFSAAFAASSLRALWKTPATAWLLRNRRYVGVGFAASHAVHLAAILGFYTGFPAAFDATVDVTTQYGGGLGYVLAAAMTATSSDRAVRALGRRRWRALHLTGGWVLFVVFAAVYWPAVAVAPWTWPFSAMLLGVVGLRAVAWRRRRGRGGPRAVSPAR